MLGEDLPQLVRIATAIADDYSSTVECNAEHLVTAEPVALCLLAASFGQLERRGQCARIRGLRPEVKQNLQRLDVLGDWLEESPFRTLKYRADGAQSDLRACRVTTLGQANELAGALSREIAAFIPSDDLDAVIDSDPTLVRYRVVEQPLEYIITELLDNSLNHGRAGGFSHVRAWVAAQYYHVGDLLRVAVVDDGCGFLQSLKNHSKVIPKTHQNATPSETSIRLAPGYQGVVVMLTLHRRAITPASFSEILQRYQSNENLPIRFN